MAPVTTTSPVRAPHRPTLSPVQRAISGGLVTVIGVNTLAPVWAPALIPQPEGVAKDVVENLLQQAERTASTTTTTTTANVNNAVSIRAQLLSQQTKDTRAMFQDVDQRLRGVDAKAGLPAGTSRAAVIERALVGAGISAELASAVAHGSQRAEQVKAGVAAMEAAVEAGRLDPAVLLLGGASLIDRLSSDVRLETAFVIGFALAPHVNATARVIAEHALQVGTGAVHAAQRHQAAVSHLKHPGTGNAVIDGAGFIAGNVVDVITAGLSFFGPGPVVGLLKGGEPALVLAQFIAAKTAMAGTQKTFATYTSVPEDAGALVAGFIAGAAAHATVDNAEAEAHATVAHVRESGQALSSAINSGDLRAVHAALHEAVASATPAERALWAHVLQTAIEHTAVAGVSAV